LILIYEPSENPNIYAQITFTTNSAKVTIDNGNVTNFKLLSHRDDPGDDPYVQPNSEGKININKYDLQGKIENGQGQLTIVGSSITSRNLEIKLQDENGIISTKTVLVGPIR
jgi:hypothetical protein